MSREDEHADACLRLARSFAPDPEHRAERAFLCSRCGKHWGFHYADGRCREPLNARSKSK